MLVAQATTFWTAKTLVTKEIDVIGDDITVIGNSMKSTVFSQFINMYASQGAVINSSIIGAIKYGELVNILRNLKFTATNREFGVGRAGENGVGIGNSEVPVVINVTALRNYNLLNGGLQYLVWHEVAHALRSMQQFNAAMWDEYRSGSGSGLSADVQAKQYPDSDQFKRNEARANTIARELAGGGANWNFTPPYGYEVP
ncbi:hypothetical protein [Novosphingobium sp. YAF33]|uniref:hypothetical protein n=1 Tax=Novosphingobium sp. YAF33 TaxID=3233082 RepID=UPI003F997427